MDFTLTDDQKMLVDTVKNFTKKDSPVERVRQIRENPNGWDKKVWQQMGELGWLGVPYAESLGGIGGTFADAGLIVEQLGTTLVPEPYVPSVMVAGLTLSRSAKRRSPANTTTSEPRRSTQARTKFRKTSSRR